MKWKELDAHLSILTKDFEYVSVDDDGYVTLYIGKVDRTDPIPSWTGLGFPIHRYVELIERKKREKENATK